MDTSTDRRREDARLLAPAGFLLGLGLGGFVDGILLHQVLQWHHLLTNRPEHADFPASSARSLEQNTLADGLFHSATWVFVTVGLYLLWRATRSGHRYSALGLTGLLLAGWGAFNLVEGVVNHHLLAIHRVRDDVADPIWWDLGFLALGALLLVTGLTMWRSDRNRRERARSGPSDLGSDTVRGSGRSEVGQRVPR